MSRKPKHRQRAPKVETITKFKRFGFRSYFLLTLALLLASGLIWYASRSPSASSYLNLGDGLESTLETISKSNSNRELKQLSDETFELFPTLALDDKLSAWHFCGIGLSRGSGRNAGSSKRQYIRRRSVSGYLAV